MSNEFIGAELRLARSFRELTLEDLAEKVGKTRQYLHKLETDQAAPTEDLLLSLCSVLGVGAGFFQGQPRNIFQEDQFHFRKRASTKLYLKQAVLSRGELISRVLEVIEESLRLPKIDLPEPTGDLSNDRIERLAKECRDLWGLGLGPISSMTRVVENRGVIVTEFASLSKEVDALSISGKRPIIVRNEAKESACRQRFDIAHELGHLVMHAGVLTGDRLTESQANYFAGAFLIPKEIMLDLFPRPRAGRLNWRSISEFKLEWKISKAALFYRAKQLQILNEDQYKSAVVTLRRSGEAVTEKEDHLLTVEKPELLVNALTVLANKKGYYLEDLAERLSLTSGFLADLLNLNSRLVNGLKRPFVPTLRLV